MAKKDTTKNIPLFKFNNEKMKKKIVVTRFLTPQEVADRLRLSRATVWRYIREGKIKAIKFSRRTYRIAEKDLARSLRKLKK
jgi:excisionase family DNA binding protein